MNLKINSFIEQAVLRIHSLAYKDFEKYLLATIASLGILAGAFTYFIYARSCTLHEEISRLQNMKKKTRKILLDFAAISEEERRLQAVLEENKNFHMKIYFETFCKENNITAVPGWDTVTTQINAQVDEISLTAGFKDMTTETLVKLLQEFDKKEIIYIKNVRIKSEKDKKVFCEITLATVRNKS
jgi:hypothetical protein